MTNKKKAFLFPGQGAQYPGMGKDFYESFPSFRLVIEEAEDRLSRNLKKLIFEGNKDELSLTNNSQVSIFVVCSAIYKVVKEEFNIEPNVCAGLSLGEYTALYASNRISFDNCLDLVNSRANYMHETAEKQPGTMAVALGLQLKEVEDILSKLILKNVWVANINCPEQIVISGDLESVSIAAKILKNAGARKVLPLKVSGAFHCKLMQPAKEKLSKKIFNVEINDSIIDFVMNASGNYVFSVDDIRNNLTEQLTSSVKWEMSINEIKKKNEDINCFEIGCGKTLSGMNKLMGLSTINVEKVTDLVKLKQ